MFCLMVVASNLYVMLLRFAFYKNKLKYSITLTIYMSPAGNNTYKTNVHVVCIVACMIYVKTVASLPGKSYLQRYHPLSQLYQVLHDMQVSLYVAYTA